MVRIDLRDAAAAGEASRAAPRCPGLAPCAGPVAVMDFEETTKRVRLKSVQPGFTVSLVAENTGFELIIAKDVPFAGPTGKGRIGDVEKPGRSVRVVTPASSVKASAPGQGRDSGKYLGSQVNL